MDRTILRPNAPRFGERETVYARVAATKGYVEPLVIVGIEFNVQRNQFMYSFSRQLSPTTQIKDIMPIKLLESELLTMCEAIEIQISVLRRQLEEAETQLAVQCGSSGGSDLPNIAQPTEGTYITTPPRPRFGYNQVVYLVETSQTTGNLEAYRISNLYWDGSVKQWVYTFHIKPRPGRTTTVGDRDDMSRGMELKFLESALGLICEVLPLRVQFLMQAYNKAVRRQEIYCSVTGAST